MSPASRAEEIASLKAALQACLNEDPINAEWILGRIERLGWSPGQGLHSGLMLLLCNLTMEEDEARREWEALLKHRASLEVALGRKVALRAAAADYLIGLNRQTSRPRLLEVAEAHRAGDREMIDPVTGLHTRRFMEGQVPREASRAARFQIDLCFVHLEIDEFARITEELGASVGTVLLREVASIVSGCIRAIDYAARMCGAEFGLLLTETDRMGGYHVAERIRQKTDEYYLARRVNGRPFGVTVSAGVAAFPEDSSDPGELARRAREAFHLARARGPGRVAIHYRERREYIRLELKNENLQVTLIPEGSKESPAGTLRNISSGGILFDSDRPIELGRTVHILCRNKKEADQVVIPGRVVRIEKFESEAGERYEIGVLFDLVVEEQLEGVIDFLERLTAEDAERSDTPRAT